jgi:hypothetical protein
MRSGNHWKSLAFATVALGCSASSDGYQDGARWVVPDAIAIQWESHFGESDTVLVAPAKIASTAQMIAVLDMGARRVVGLDRSTGRHAWTYAKNGSGPAELKEPADIGVDPDGDFYVIDGANGKVVWLGSDGQFIGESTSGEMTSVRSSCMMQDRRLLVFQLSVGTPIVLISKDGKKVGATNVPWASTVSAGPSMSTDPGAMMSELVRTNQGVFGGNGRQLCAYAGQTSNGLALFSEGTLRWTRSTQVEVPDDSLRASSISSISTGIRGDAVLVASIGVGESRGRFIDAYAVNDGAYLKSWTTPSKMSWVSFDSLGIVALRVTASGATISSWRLADSTR